MSASIKKEFEIKKYSKPEVKNLGKVGTKTQYGKSKTGSDSTSSTHYNPGQDLGFTGTGTPQ